MFKCRVCGSRNLLKTFDAREMMFGTRDVFSYDQCAGCESVQISDLPEPDILQKYYPRNYYAYNTNVYAATSPKRLVKDFVMKRRDAHVVTRSGLFGALAQMLRPADVKLASLQSLELKRTDAILDLGCGEAALLLNRLARIGFNNLLGVDPFISADTISVAGVTVLKRQIGDVTSKFDLIMMHHSFEHMPAPVETLIHAERLLTENGRCLIRIPTPSSAAYEIYGSDWVQLDPPRHLTLISRQGMQGLASQAGLVIECAFDDSSSFQFVGSELYKQDIPLTEQVPERFFPAARIRMFDEQSRTLNAAQRGDQSCFILARR
jgi:SAM-dependent methyltransferase